MSTQQLSDRCGELGLPIARSVLANFESGRRPTVSVPELLVLAKALDVAPLALVFPVGYETETEALPGRMEHPVTALRWASGEHVLPVRDESEEGAAERWSKTAMYRIRRLLKFREAVDHNKSVALTNWLSVRKAETPESRQAYEQAAQYADSTVRAQEKWIEDARREWEEDGFVLSLPSVYELPRNLVVLPDDLYRPEEDEDTRRP